MSYQIYNITIYSGLTNNPNDGSISYDPATNSTWIAFNGQWKKAEFNEREFNRLKLLENRKQKLNKINGEIR